MLTEDECGRLWEHYGDMKPCHLHFNHGGDCLEANRQAFIDSLHERTWQAEQGPWL